MIDWKLFEQDPQGFAEKIRHRTSEFDDAHVSNVLEKLHARRAALATLDRARSERRPMGL